MSTIKSSDEHLTLNADGSSKDIKFQANGVEKASISSSGAFTSTTIDATKLTGDLPAISGANLTGVGVAGITSSADATAITIDSSENVGIGTTPESGQGSNSQGLYVGTHASVISNGAYESVSVSENAYLGTAANDTWKYRDTSHAARHEMKAGVHTFKVAASGTADADITWTTALEITNGGRVVSQSNAHAWLTMNGTGTISISDSYNVSSIADNGTGFYDMNFDVDMANASYAAVGNSGQYAGSINPYAKFTATYAFKSFDDNAAAADDANIMIIAFGDTA